MNLLTTVQHSLWVIISRKGPWDAYSLLRFAAFEVNRASSGCFSSRCPLWWTRRVKIWSCSRPQSGSYPEDWYPGLAKLDLHTEDCIVLLHHLKNNAHLYDYCGWWDEGKTCLTLHTKNDWLPLHLYISIIPLILDSHHFLKPTGAWWMSIPRIIKIFRDYSASWSAWTWLLPRSRFLTILNRKNFTFDTEI